MKDGMQGSGAKPCSEGTPKFSPRKGMLVREYHVLVTWPDGRRMKTGRFPRKPDAKRWIEQKSAEWLAQIYATAEPT
jgi:hypothetical protein